MGIEDPVGLHATDYSIALQINTLRKGADPLNHSAVDGKKLNGRYKCGECQKRFGNRNILRLHLQEHETNKQTASISYVSDTVPVSAACDVVSRNCVEKKANHVHNIETQQGHQNQLPAKKVIGLSKVRLEDCRRCDACSCIYLDETDYNKHMKNFHCHDTPRRRTRVRSKKVCISCCKNCKCDGNHELLDRQKPVSDHRLHHNIKDRWSKLMQGNQTAFSEMCPMQDIKSEPVDDSVDETLDYSHLLSQVEVRIKTEPPDDMAPDDQLAM